MVKRNVIFENDSSKTKEHVEIRIQRNADILEEPPQEDGQIYYFTQYT